MGHPAPFHLEMMGVGNEQWGARYLERYKVFAAALKAKHPEIKLVVSAGPAPAGEPFDTMWANWRQLKPDIVDEHYYMNPEWFLNNTGRYDHYDRSGPKIFAGEYAAQTSGVAKPDNHNNWRAAISEAAFMTGLERNGDVVQMASYAPLLAHVDGWQWTPDAIWFDNLHSYGTPNYYVQRIFANNAGTRIVPATPQAEAGLYTSASLDERTHELIVKAINTTASPRPARDPINGPRSIWDGEGHHAPKRRPEHRKQPRASDSDCTRTLHSRSEVGKDLCAIASLLGECLPHTHVSPNRRRL